MIKIHMIMMMSLMKQINTQSRKMVVIKFYYSIYIISQFLFPFAILLTLVNVILKSPQQYSLIILPTHALIPTSTTRLTKLFTKSPSLLHKTVGLDRYHYRNEISSITARNLAAALTRSDFIDIQQLLLDTKNNKNKNNNNVTASHSSSHYLQQDNDTNNNNTNNQNKPQQRRSINNRVFKNPGAYSDLDENELTIKTIDFLRSCEVGQMNTQQVHEVKRLISSWTKRYVVKSGTIAEALLLRLIYEQDAGNVHAMPTVDNYNSVINAWTKCGVHDGAERATEILALMEERFLSQNNPGPVAKCYVTAIDGWCKAGERGSAEVAHSLLEKLGELPYHGWRSTKHFNAVLNAYADESKFNPRCVQQIEELFHEMKALSSTTQKKVGVDEDSHQINSAREVDIKPNTRTYNIIIKALSYSKRRTSIIRAEKLLYEMERALFDENGDKSICPDRISYTSILTAWANSDDIDGIKKAEYYLGHMQSLYEKGHTRLKPDTITYNNIINVIAKSRLHDAAERSERILDLMIESNRSGDKTVKPTIISFNSVINAYAINPNHQSISRCFRLLDMMKSMSVKPDIVTYNSILNVFAKNRNATGAQDLLEELQLYYDRGDSSIKPDTYSYNIVMGAWANCGHKYAANKVEILFKRMDRLVEAGNQDVKPDITSFNTLLLAWSRANDPDAADRAWRVFTQMYQMKKSGRRDIQLTQQSFTIVINAWSKSKDPNKAVKSRKLLLLMNELANRGEKHLRPNVFVYTTVLNACAYTLGDKETKSKAFRIAQQTFNELENSKYASANHVAYGSYIKACLNLTETYDKIRLKLLESIVEKCCRDGQLSDGILKQILSSSSPDMLFRLLGPLSSKTNLSWTDLPQKWRSNVKERSFITSAKKK